MRELEVVRGGEIARRGSGSSSVDLIEVARQAEAARDLGATLIRSGLLPDGITKPEQAMAILLTARELGLEPMFALKNITVIQGAPAPSEQCVGVLVRRAGHKMRVIESTNERCTVEGVRADDPAHGQRVSFSIEDAKRANLLGKSSWRNYPRAMLRARAKTELCRGMFEDALAGLAYSAEELGAEVNEDGDALSVPSTPGGQRRGTVERLRGEPVEEAEVVEGRGPSPQHQGLLDELADLQRQIPPELRPDSTQLWDYASSKIGNAGAALTKLKGILDTLDDMEEGSEEHGAEYAGDSDEDGEEDVPDFEDMRGAAAATEDQKASKNQIDLIRGLAEDRHGPASVAHLENRIGKPLAELTRQEAADLAEELSPEEG